MSPIAYRDPCPLAVTKTFSLNFAKSITPPLAAGHREIPPPPGHCIERNRHVTLILVCLFDLSLSNCSRVERAGGGGTPPKRGGGRGHMSYPKWTLPQSPHHTLRTHLDLPCSGTATLRSPTQQA